MCVIGFWVDLFVRVKLWYIFLRCIGCGFDVGVMVNVRVC